jgi:hypothetical protein
MKENLFHLSRKCLVVVGMRFAVIVEEIQEEEEEHLPQDVILAYAYQHLSSSLPGYEAQPRS